MNLIKKIKILKKPFWNHTDIANYYEISYKKAAEIKAKALQEHFDNRGINNHNAYLVNSDLVLNTVSKSNRLEKIKEFKTFLDTTDVKKGGKQNGFV